MIYYIVLNYFVFIKICLKFSGSGWDCILMLVFIKFKDNKFKNCFGKLKNKFVF